MIAVFVMLTVESLAISVLCAAVSSLRSGIYRMKNIYIKTEQTDEKSPSVCSVFALVRDHAAV